MYLEKNLTAGGMFLTLGFAPVLVSLGSDGGAIASVWAFFAVTAIHLRYHADQQLNWDGAIVASMFITTILALSYLLTGLMKESSGNSPQFESLSGAIGWGIVAVGVLILGFAAVADLWHRLRRSSA